MLFSIVSGALKGCTHNDTSVPVISFFFPPRRESRLGIIVTFFSSKERWNSKDKRRWKRSKEMADNDDYSDPKFW